MDALGPKHTKTVHTVVDDIYALVKTKRIDKAVDADAEIEKFGEAVKDLMRKEFVNRGSFDGRKLRMSNIGKDDRYLWNHYNNVGPKEPMQPHTLVKFLYGHLIEEMLLFLTRLSGHSVTDEQKECEIEGIKGHMDCKIDGVVTDVKSASSYGFKKFKNATLAFDDPFGYIDQIKAYAHSEGETKFGWLAMDKQNGHLTYLQYDLEDTQAPVYEVLKEDIVERIRHVKKARKGSSTARALLRACTRWKEWEPKVRRRMFLLSFQVFVLSPAARILLRLRSKILSRGKNEPKVPEIQGL